MNSEVIPGRFTRLLCPPFTARLVRQTRGSEGGSVAAHSDRTSVFEAEALSASQKLLRLGN